MPISQTRSLRLKAPDEVCHALEMFLFEHVGQAGGAVLGLSGGIDSALVLTLATRALGPERVVGLLLPDGAVTPAQDMEDAAGWARTLGVTTRTVSLAPLLDAFRRTPLGEASRHRQAWGNLKARLRMACNYALANQEGRLVLGTGNRTELLVGYFTKYGDGGVDLLPLGGLYKTQVRQLARHLKLPSAFLAKPPSAGLWDGQTDEDELGLAYELLDQALHLLVDRRYPAHQVAQALGLDERRVHQIERSLEASQHKRQLPPIPALE